MEKRKLESDQKLIRILTGADPLDWNRLDNGNLVYLNQAGQKFVMTPDEISQKTDYALEEKVKKSSKKPADKQIAVSSTYNEQKEEK